MALRYDVGGFKANKLRRTPQGGIIVPASVARTGVLEYTLPDGSVRREYRPPEEVFNEDSLESMRSVIVTRLHPPEEIRPSNWEEYSIGQVDGAARPKKSAGLLDADLAINSPGAVNEIESRELSEVSAGYSVDMDETPGVSPDGERYDAIQRNIRFNHIAIGPSQWGRSGPEVSLRLDSLDGVSVPALRDKNNKEDTMSKVIKLDGVEYEFGSEAHVARLDEQMSKIEEERDDAEKKATDAEEEKVSLEQKVDELSKKVDELMAHNDELSEKNSKMDSLVDERVALISHAKKFIPELKADGKSAREIMEESILSVRKDSSFEGKSDEFVSGVFESLEVPQDMNQIIETQPGESRADSLEVARAAMEKRAAEAWKVGK